MEIWIFNHYATSPDSIGVSRHYDLAKYLVRKGVKVKIFASSFNHQTRVEEHIIDNEKVKLQQYDGVDFVWIKTRPYKKNDLNRVLNILDYSFKLSKYLIKYKGNKPDTIIGSLMHPLAPVVGLIFAKKWKKNFIFEERDMWPQSLIDLGKVKKSNPIVKLLGLLEKGFYKYSDKVILLFDKAHIYAIGQGLNKDKIIYLSNGVDLERFDFNVNSQTDELLPKEITEFFNEDLSLIHI